MDWIERWFNVSPDKGDGTLEALLITFGLAVVMMFIAATRPAYRRMLDRIRAAWHPAARRRV